MEKLLTGLVDDVGDAVDPVLGQFPVPGVNAVSNSREKRGIVTGPKLWAEDNVAELCAVRNLVIVRWGQ